VSYAYAHKKVYRARGKAVTYDCLDCGRQASEWAYVPGDPHEDSAPYTRTVRGVTTTSIVSWSPNVFAYDPLCVPCHTKRDKG
jgi:hypothetical protein